VSVSQTTLDLSFLLKRDTRVEPIFQKVGSFDLFDDITDACLLSAESAQHAGVLEK